MSGKGKRARKPVVRLGSSAGEGEEEKEMGSMSIATGGGHEEEDAASSSGPRKGRGGGRGGGAAAAAAAAAASDRSRAGRANKKRDDRSALVEVWMCKNEAGSKPSPELKAQYAELLRIPRARFWDTMKTYALKSRVGCVPDFEQIWHHMKDDAAPLLADLKVHGVDYWWELDAASGCYKPNTQNLKNFKPASGLLHHFYHAFIHDPMRYEEVRFNPALEPGGLAAHAHAGGKGGKGGRGSKRAAAAAEARVEPGELDELVTKLSPFRILPEPKALLVLPNSETPAHLALRGTYALGKKVGGFNVFLRAARGVTGRGLPAPGRRTVVVNGTSVDVPEARAENYAVEENALALLIKEEKKAGEDGGGGGDGGLTEACKDVAIRVRVPPGYGGHSGRGRGGQQDGAQLLEGVVDDLGEATFDLTHALGVMVYPIRGLLPIPEIMRFIDFGAVWNGCFAPFPRTAASLQEFAAAFDDFPEECLRFFFLNGSLATAASSTDILAEEYIRFMTWFANFDDGLGQACCNARALHRSMEGLPFRLTSAADELRTRGRVGGFALRLSDTKPCCLTLEVLAPEGGHGHGHGHGHDEAHAASGAANGGGGGGGGGGASPGAPVVLCYRIRIAFDHSEVGNAKKAAAAGLARGASGGLDLPQVEFALEDAAGAVSGTGHNRLALGGALLRKVEALVGVPLTPLAPLSEEEEEEEKAEADEGLGRSHGGGRGHGGGKRAGGARDMAPPATRVLPAGSAATAGSLKRKRGQQADPIPPPMSKMGTAGASAFNDQTFDINGEKQLAAAQVRRGVSNVPGAAAAAGGGGELGRGESDASRGVSLGGPGPNGNGGGGAAAAGGGGGGGAPLQMWGQHIPMPQVGRDHSLAPPPVGPSGSIGGLGLRSESIGKGDSWGSVMKGVSLSPSMVGREHSLGLGFSGLSRDMSLGSLGELPTLSRGPSQAQQPAPTPQQPTPQQQGQGEGEGENEGEEQG